MEQLIIQVVNKEKAEMLSQMLSALDFVSSVESINQNTNISQEESDFFSLAGLWENREITTESLRKQAWRE